MTARALSLLLLLAALVALAGCETVEKPADSMLPQAQPASWQGGIPGAPNQGSGFR